jgi:hypothetical protein
MSTTRYDCAEPFYPAPVTGVPVGSGPIWGDDSDATYADSYSTGGHSSMVDWPAAYLAAAPASAEIESLTIHLRAALLPGWDDDRVGIYAGTTVGLGDNDLISLIEPTAVTQVHITDTPADYVIESEFPAAFVNVLTGAWFVTVVPQFTTVTARIFELWFEVGRAGGINPLRRYPPVGNGGHGPTRRTASGPRRARGGY